MNKKNCFVIMGFGRKTDPSTGKTLDLDKTYKNIIQPAVIQSGYNCVRADEIQDSSLIDKSMYALLIHADLVIADITTYNPNAIYELGIRHAVKPFSTIILKEKEGKIPFDLDHTRIFSYSHLGEDIGADEAKRCVKALVALITQVSKENSIDSPLYQYINVTPPQFSDDEYQNIIEELAQTEKSIFVITEAARCYMDQSKFMDASTKWMKAHEMIPNEVFFTQQLALSRYKSKHPSEGVALTDALNIIEDLHPTNDPETLGITGAINKQLYFIHNDIEYLKRAIENYAKGYSMNNENYYTGENFALCMNLMEVKEEDSEQKIYYKISAKKIRETIIDNLKLIIESEDIDSRLDKKWIYATLANCYLGIGDNENKNKFEEIFLNLAVEWEKETYQKNKEILIRYLK